MNFRKVEKFFFLSFIARVLRIFYFEDPMEFVEFLFFIFIFLVINYKNLSQDFENSCFFIRLEFFSSCLSSGILILINNSGISVPRMKFRFTDVFIGCFNSTCYRWSVFFDVWGNLNSRWMNFRVIYYVDGW